MQSSTASNENSVNYKDLFQTMDLGVVYQDAEGNIITANPAAEKILGLSLNQMKGRTSMHPEWRAVGENRLDLPGEQHPAMIALQTRKKVNNFLQGIYNPKLKDYVWILVNSVPQFRKESKEPHQVYSTFLDITERKNAEEKIQKAKEQFEISETRFRKSQEAGHIGSWEFNLQTNEYWGSDEAKRIFNLKLNERVFPVEKISNIVAEKDREKFNREMIDLVDKKKPYDIIYEINPKKTSKKKIIHSIAELQEDANGNPLKVTGVLLDITERIKKEEQIEANEQQLRAVVQQLQAHEQQLQASDQQLRAANQQLQAGEQQLQAANQQLQASEQQLQAANQQLKANEQALITAKEEAERNEKYYHTIINNMGDPVFVKDDQSRLLLVNHAFCKIFDLKREAIIGKTLAEDVTLEEQEQFLSIDKEVLNTGQENINEETLTVRGSESLTISTRKTRFLDNTGRKFLVGVIRDITERKLAEQKIKESEEKYRALYQNAPLAYQSLNIDGQIRDVNPQWLKTLGYKRDEIVGRWFGDFLQSDSRENFRINFKRFKEKGTVSGVEFKMLKSNGAEITVSFEGCIGYDEKGNFKQTYCTFKDITKQIIYEQKLKQSDRVFSLSLDMFCIAGFDGYFKYLNPSWEKTLGWSVEELLSKPWLEFVYPEDVEKTENVKSVLVDGKEIYKFENRYICKDGSIKWLAWNSQPFPDENSMIGAVRDITESKEIEQELIKAKEKAEESNANVTAIIEGTNNSIWAFNNNYEILYINHVFQQEFLQAFGVRLEQGVNLIESLPETLQPFWKPRYDRVLANEQFTLEDAVPAQNGTIFIQVTFNPIVKNGQVIGGSCFGENITQRKTGELELIKAKEKAEESDRLKSAFLANMSHEIRTPMNGILGFTSLLKEPELTGNQQKQYIEIIEKSGSRMLNTINDIIDISRIESGQVEMNISEINLNKLVNELFEFFLPEAKKKNLRLSITNNIQNQQIYLKTDKLKLDSILTNLIKNAIKYTHSGNIELGYSMKEGNCKKELEFYVKDSGIGIPKDRQEAVFNRFVQADIEDKQVYQGSGLGLAISKAYVEMLGGKINVESEPGLGSTFWFTLPLTDIQQEPETLKHQEITNNPQNKHLNILIAEDDDASYQHLSIVLNKKAKRIDRVVNGKEAFTFMKDTTDVHLILMDIKMPVMDGYETTKRIREFNKEVTIIAQTAHALLGDKEKAIEVGCNDYITKPIKKDELFEKIDYFFNQ